MMWMMPSPASVEEIDQHDRPEHQPDPGRPARLDGEQAEQDGDGRRDDIGLEAGLDRRQSLDRRQHRNRRRDHRIAVEQCGGEDAEHDDARRPFLLLGRRAVDQGEQGQAAALALVVGAHDDEDVFQRHDDHHRPEDQAQHAVDVQRIGIDRVMAGKGLAEGVDRRGADIAEHDADRPHHHLGERSLGMMAVAGFGLRLRDGGARGC